MGRISQALSWGKEIKAENSILLKKLTVQGVGIVFDLPVGFSSMSWKTDFWSRFLIIGEERRLWLQW